jgi:hypothetical protein
LETLTVDFDRDGVSASAVMVYAEPDPELIGAYNLVVAADTGYEGIACVDDTARAANLALAVYERNRSRKALSLARRWLSFVEYMQYPDGQFANFIRNSAGVRNASGPTSIKGGHWWTVRALWVLARAYRLTGNKTYLTRYDQGSFEVPADCKLQAVMVLAELEIFRVNPAPALRAKILDRCQFIASTTVDGFFRDQPGSDVISMWGYHQLHAVTLAAQLLEEPGLLPACRRTVQTLIEPDIRARFWHSYPARETDGVCPYDVAPIVQGLSAMYRATGAKRYRHLALQGCAWFYGRNSARAKMYDPSTGRCRDGISGAVASLNCGAESAIEAGFAELERRSLFDIP